MRNTAIGATAVIAVLAGLVAAGPAPAAPATSAAEKPAGVEKAETGMKHGKPGKPGKAASVHGKGRIAYIESLDHDIRFSVDAEQKPFTRPLPGAAPDGLATDAEGILKFSHTTPNGFRGWAEAKVDCLVTSGRTATLTAVVNRSNVEEAGTRLGISVQQGTDGEPDRLGFSWGVVNIDPANLDEEGRPNRLQAGSCMAPAPFTIVTEGGFDVVHAEIRKTPEFIMGAVNRRD
ncbi:MULTISPECIES: hypothetical protein [unclassified Streptomyces]|uniref:hypothetical protein n=1 Tax=unclassified Streptomyces TaxID=2593676 RepID=UPI0035DE9E03